jgi:hypothetical protein
MQTSLKKINDKHRRAERTSVIMPLSIIKQQPFNGLLSIDGQEERSTMRDPFGGTDEFFLIYLLPRPPSTQPVINCYVRFCRRRPATPHREILNTETIERQ